MSNPQDPIHNLIHNPGVDPTDDPQTGDARSTTSEGDNIHTDIGCYVLDQLDPAETAAFEAHLLGCESCTQEAAEFSETAAELALLTAAGPPASLRDAILTGIRTVRPLPPITDPNDPAANTDDGDAAAVAPDASGERDPLDELAARRSQARVRSRIRNPRLWIGVVAAAIALVVVGGVAVVTVTQQHQAQVAAQAAAQRETDLLAAPDVRVITQTRDGGSYRFVVSRQRNEALLIPTGLPDPGTDRTYQLWTLQGRRAIPDATMPATTRSQWFTGDITRASTLAVTIEPTGGSAQPTPPILAQATI